MKINRRNFVRNVALAGFSSALRPSYNISSLQDTGELLYNGIRLPKIWPPRNLDIDAYEPMPVPYLSSPPGIIPIDIGRQLFVDDFLIEETDLKRVFHKPMKSCFNPVLKPTTALEQGPSGMPAAIPTDGGVWWDSKDKIFKMWYTAGWYHATAYAESRNGKDWIRPHLNIGPDTNRILPELIPDSNTVFLDPYAANSNERFKLFFRPPWHVTQKGGVSMVSSDGIHWRDSTETGPCGDRSTIFYNPFRKKWVYSLRSGPQLGASRNGRIRFYWETDDFMKGAKWKASDPVYWAGADYLDLPDPLLGDKPQLYNLSANAYESIMLGLFEIWLGPSNKVIADSSTPKVTDIKIAFSRDGFHWDRPNREAFIPSSRRDGSWDRGYVQTVGGICNIVGDELWFYYTGLKGRGLGMSTNVDYKGEYAAGSTGIAILRRDGFASMVADRAGGVLTSRLVKFKGRFLFVNLNTPYDGYLKAEILDRSGDVISPFTKENCIAVSANSTIERVSWKGVDNISALIGREIRFRFYLMRGELYSFWVSTEESGASNGYNAAGGPGFEGPTDTNGKLGYKTANQFQMNNYS